MYLSETTVVSVYNLNHPLWQRRRTRHDRGNDIEIWQRPNYNERMETNRLNELPAETDG